MKILLMFICCLSLSAMIVGRGQADELKIEDAPVSVASFGSIVCGDYLYLYGGNEGVAHKFSMEGQNNEFRRIKLASGSKWESLGATPRLQGLALVTHGGKIYRMGGFTARNTADKDQDLLSNNDFEVFDPETKKWSDLPNLPETRSSFDAVVVGDTIYMIGGWALMGKDDDSQWHKTAWKFNLGTSGAKWEELKTPPFVRRANSLSFHGKKIFCIGGMGPQGGPSKKVAIYDPANDSWSEGPELPGSPMDGFGSSAFNVGGDLIVSTFSGQILKVSADDTKWIKINQMETGRFFHRLVGIDKHRFAILGGSGGTAGKMASVLVYTTEAQQTLTQGDKKED